MVSRADTRQTSAHAGCNSRRIRQDPHTVCQQQSSYSIRSAVEREEPQKQRQLSRVIVDIDYITLTEALWLRQALHPDSDLLVSPQGRR